MEWPLRELHEPAFESCGHLACDLRDLLLSPMPGYRFWLSLLFVLGPPAGLAFFAVQPIGETQCYGQIFILLVLTALILATVCFFQFFQAWRLLWRILHRLDHNRMAKAFTRISKEVAWKPMKSFDWRVETFEALTLYYDRLKAIERWPSLTAEGRLKKVYEAYRLQSKTIRERQRGTNKAIHACQEINESILKTYSALAVVSTDREVEELFALGLVAYLRYMFAHLRNWLTGAMVTGLFVLAAVRTYAFEPKRFVSIGIFAALLSAIALTLWTFAEMNRNPCLSAISDTPGDEISFDRHFFSNIFTYGVIPLAGIVVTQFPQVGRYVVGWLNPLLHVVGAG